MVSPENFNALSVCHAMKRVNNCWSRGRSWSTPWLSITKNQHRETSCSEEQDFIEWHSHEGMKNRNQRAQSWSALWRPWNPRLINWMSIISAEDKSRTPDSWHHSWRLQSCIQNNLSFQFSWNIKQGVCAFNKQGKGKKIGREQKSAHFAPQVWTNKPEWALRHLCFLTLWHLLWRATCELSSLGNSTTLPRRENYFIHCSVPSIRTPNFSTTVRFQNTHQHP